MEVTCGQVVALKVYNSSRKKSLDNLNTGDQVETEIKILSELPPCRYVVEYVASFQSPNERLMCLVTRLVRGETLQAVVEKQVRSPLLLFFLSSCSGSDALRTVQTCVLVSVGSTDASEEARRYPR